MGIKIGFIIASIGLIALMAIIFESSVHGSVNEFKTNLRAKTKSTKYRKNRFLATANTIWLSLLAVLLVFLQLINPHKTDSLTGNSINLKQIMILFVEILFVLMIASAIKPQDIKPLKGTDLLALLLLTFFVLCIVFYMLYSESVPFVGDYIRGKLQIVDELDAVDAVRIARTLNYAPNDVTVLQ